MIRSATALCLALCVGPASGYYLPGVNPQSFAEGQQ